MVQLLVFPLALVAALAFELITMMINELSFLAGMIFDLSKATDLDLLGESRFKSVAGEYPRISAALSRIWDKRESGWVYQLDFHAAETSRLLLKLRIDRTYHQVVHSYGSGLEDLLRTYEMLEELLAELHERIDLLSSVKRLELSSFNDYKINAIGNQLEQGLMGRDINKIKNEEEYQ